MYMLIYSYKNIIFNINSSIRKQFKKSMGLLSDMGPVLSFEQGHKLQPRLKCIAIRQFLHIFNRYQKWNKSSQIDEIKWGQQIEGSFLEFDENHELQLSKINITEDYSGLEFPLMFQYGRYMFEVIPLHPYNTKYNLDEIIRSIRHKYKVLQSKDRIPLTIPAIPFLGVRNPKKQIQQPFINTITQSQYISDDHIAPHPRFPTLTKNIRLRRGHTVDIRVPLLIEENTNMQQIKATNEPYEGQIYLDAMCFGMGLCCLQCTFSTKNIDHARYVYDQLNVLSPIFLALTAGTPFIKGKVSAWDVRWNIISGSVDDRTEDQRNPQHANYIPDSRYSSTNLYISNGQYNRPEYNYNDYDLRIKPEELNIIRKHSKDLNIPLDELMTHHIANIMKRDILIVHEKFPEMQTTENTLFEMLNGTNWNSVRLKIPIDDEIGWRVEFRTMEVQLTADENAAYSMIIHLIMRIFHETGDLNLYIPITKLRENFNRAHKIDALRKQKFYFRTNILDKGEPVIEELTIHEILFGKSDYKGLYFMLLQRMQKCVKMCPKMKILTDSIENFLRATTSGKRLTLAQWMRKYVNEHPLYTKNSILPKKTMDDMLLTLSEISKGNIKDDNFIQIFELWAVGSKIDTSC